MSGSLSPVLSVSRISRIRMDIKDAYEWTFPFLVPMKIFLAPTFMFRWKDGTIKKKAESGAPGMCSGAASVPPRS